MKTLIRNFTHTFRRFFTASVLNIVGLAVAFASFFVIMTQVDYDLNFNKGYKDYDRIYRLEFDQGQDNGWQSNLPRPFCEQLVRSSSPYIESMSLLDWDMGADFEVDGHLFHEMVQKGFGNFVDVFSPEMVCGNADALEVEDHILISQSMALRFFGTADAVGKTVFFGKKADNQPLVVGGVYKDFPENTQLGNPVFMPCHDRDNKDYWNAWNYRCYVRLSDPSQADEIQRRVMEKTAEMDPFGPTVVVKGRTDFFRLVPLSEVHFSTGTGGTSRTTVYLLLCVSFLIVVVAAINFLNFMLAETPTRVKSINTQKVLGASVRSLRASLVGESVLVSVSAFLLSLLLLLALHDSGVQDLVTADLTLGKHPALLSATAALSVLMGVAAGVYPSRYVTSFPPALVLKGSFGLSPKGRRLRTVLVCVQFFVSFVLVIAIGIMYAQSRYIRVSDYGYARDAIVVGEMTQDAIMRQDAVVDELSRVSGVEGVALSQFVLSSGDDYMSWGWGEGDKMVNADILPVDHRYFDVMGIRITEGRGFKPTDSNAFIFNETAHRKYPWLTLGEPPAELDFGDGTLPCELVGFCENVRYTTFRSDNEERPMAFILYGKDLKRMWWPMTVNVRVSAGTDRVEVVRSLQKAMEKFTPGHDFNFRFMDRVLDDAYRNELRFTCQILLFSLLAIVISMIGVFGLTMFESEYRRKEIGIRKIFGSTTGEILRMFNRRYLYILLGCFVAAAPFGWWIGHHWLEGFAEKTPIRAWIFLASFLVVTCVTLLTVTVQSWRTASENPASSIKTE